MAIDLSSRDQTIFSIGFPVFPAVVASLPQHRKFQAGGGINPKK